ncbi:hypothetical protein CHS0354_038175 [Potamilus streckersoni]|uniref:Uncharacterized protein n=1 Tax=Potamilus streckersoni TaxID=2493646 RepID=A0AAE0T0N5_9BIVA|nr:hypothetical protein CHS0354_038175 [Potamilus streckersoni]
MRCLYVIALVLLFSCGVHMSKIGFDWDYFTYSQQWPPAVCISGEREHHTCDIPADIQYWVVHGLWPTKSGSKGPEDCNSSYPFVESQIQPVETQLDTVMPNLYTDTPHTSFWGHEWDKHGTCCTDLATTANELDYFTAIINLHSKFNLLRILGDSGINPGKTSSYTLDEYQKALSDGLGQEPSVYCVYDEKSGEQVISQVEICINKTFQPISCEKTMQEDAKVLRFSRHGFLQYRAQDTNKQHITAASNCPKTKKIYYPSIGNN